MAASEARIEVYVSPNGSASSLTKEEIKQRLDERYDVEITAANGRLTAVAKSKERIKDWKKALNIAYKIYVPQAVSTDLATSGGSIRLENLSGTQKFSTSGGSLHIEGLSGKIDGRTSGGSIQLRNSKDDIQLSTSGGSINADHCSGTLQLSTSGGSLTLENLDGNVTAKTSGGSVHADNVKGGLVAATSGGNVKLNNIAGNVEAETSGGGIEATVSEAATSVKLRNEGGNVRLQLPANKGFDLDLRADKINVQLANFTGRADENTVKGKLKEGGTVIDVRTSGGKINLDFK